MRYKKINGEYIYPGFLSKMNLNDVCVPCCFKNTQLESKNKSRRGYFIKCIGGDINSNLIEDNKDINKIYILKDSNRIQNNKFVYLSETTRAPIP